MNSHLMENSFPTGTILTFAGTNPPAGYLVCDGRAYLSTDYPALFETIGSLHGRGISPSTDFNVPLPITTQNSIVYLIKT